MIKLSFAAIASLAIAVAPAYAEDRPLISPEDFSNISIHVEDSATNGCWTNIGETRTYLRDKLELRGFNIVEHDKDRPNAFDEGIAYLRVSGARVSSGCYGQVSLEMLTRLDWGDCCYFARPIGYEANQSFTGYINANELVLELVREFAESWPNYPK